MKSFLVFIASTVLVKYSRQDENVGCKRSIVGRIGHTECSLNKKDDDSVIQIRQLQGLRVHRSKGPEFLQQHEKYETIQAESNHRRRTDKIRMSKGVKIDNLDFPVILAYPINPSRESSNQKKRLSDYNKKHTTFNRYPQYANDERNKLFKNKLKGNMQGWVLYYPQYPSYPAYPGYLGNPNAAPSPNSTSSPNTTTNRKCKCVNVNRKL